MISIFYIAYLVCVSSYSMPRSISERSLNPNNQSLISYNTSDSDPEQDCPWLEPSGKNWHYVCIDGTECTEEDCCVGNGGRAKCPKNSPFMCNAFDCVGDTDHCCSARENSCSRRDHGGLRQCDLCGTGGNNGGAALANMPIKVSTSCDCSEACAKQINCKAWTFSTRTFVTDDGRNCWLRSQDGGTVENCDGSCRSGQSGQGAMYYVAQGNNGSPCEEVDGDCSTRLVSSDKILAIRCCSDTKVANFINKGSMEGCWGSSYFGERDHTQFTSSGQSIQQGCTEGTFSEANEKCISEGGRLCTIAELAGGCTAGTGCWFNTRLIWTSDTGENSCQELSDISSECELFLDRDGNYCNNWENSQYCEHTCCLKA